MMLVFSLPAAETGITSCHDVIKWCGRDVSDCVQRSQQTTGKEN